jgi:hypothetical protein
MIIKGASRGGPRQLAYHLQRADTNERVEVLELVSPLDDLRETFRDWQFLSTGTRGTKGLYHANIDPAEQYRMTREQWMHAVDVLEQQLGLGGQPRAVVLHEKHGRAHIHVVWQRTDIDTMTLRSDSWNYKAHERASLALELEFGHDLVPGKHAKRDPSRAPPKEALTHAEWQQAERSEIDPRERKAAITELLHRCDSGQAFKNAIEKEGYVLAAGDRRDFVLVDDQGQVHSLGRQVKGMKAAELRAFMADVEREALPNVEQAKELQQQHLREREVVQTEQQRKATADEERGREAARVEEQRRAVETAREQETKRQELETAIAKRLADERKRLETYHAAERRHLQKVLERETAEKMKLLDFLQEQERARVAAELKARRQGLKGAVYKAKKVVTPKRAEQDEAKRRKEWEALKAKQAEERAARLAPLEREAQKELADLAERHAQQLRVLAARTEKDRARLLRDEENAHRLRQELEERKRREELQHQRDGPQKGPKLTR